MISRRQIIRDQQDGGQVDRQTMSSSSSTKQSSTSKPIRSNQQQVRGQQSQQVANKSARKTPTSRSSKDNEQQQQQDSSDGYIVNQYDDYAQNHLNKDSFWRNKHQENLEAQQEENGVQANEYRHFDPYSIYEDEEVWYSNERLFQDHLEEIFNKWNLLDDDIWCKLIIMERNRRIGKAYARVPIVTIDGSQQLSYDGYKLALNGFDNPARDRTTEECRKLIGKGIRIKMDRLGNILIKRLSKYGVYIKDWSQTQYSSNSANDRVMPSRQQLIKNQNAMLAAMNNGNGRALSSQMSSLTTSATQSSSSSGSSLDPPNDSAVPDEIIDVGGKLDQDKIYVMFDMNKFQANITQELCRPYPDIRKLEQQCFSIISLTQNAEDILNLPCWVMVINIVALEMLNERFPLMDSKHTSFPDTMLLDPTNRRGHNQQPNFVSVFEQNNNNERLSKDGSNKEEDPYSLPANASSSDVKSSINDYSTTSTKNMDSNGHQIMSPRYYGVSKRAEMYAHKKELSRNTQDGSLMDNMKHRSKSNCNIFGPHSKQSSSRYNNNSSIYSPGHMLVPPPSGDSVPPKLPPRDFVKKGKSKSSSNVSYDGSSKINHPNNESVYSTGLGLNNSGTNDSPSDSSKVRKTKKNRFLESLKAPLELAKSNRSASVLGAPVQPVEDKKIANKNKGFSKSGSKNFKSFLGVKVSKTKDTISDENNYVHVDEVEKIKKSTRVPSDGVEVDSVVDSNEEVDDSQHITNSSSSASYIDLDIPTPDYETDENIYALEGGNYPGYSSDKQRGGHDIRRSGVNNKNSKSSKIHNKEDLYYSGFRAHVPLNIGSHGNTRAGASSKSSMLEEKLSNFGSRENSRYLMHNKMINSKINERDMIYGSTTGLPAMSGGARYRSASMQRYYPRTQAARSQTEMYDLELENPYAMSGSIDVQGHYGITGHRKRSSSKIANPFTNSNGGILNRVASSMANSNYDIGRSSSGIYGINSSSSSSDYADWHPQMRKVNSSGYLNSIFKNHIASPGDSFNTNVLNNNSNNNHNHNSTMTNHGYNNDVQQQHRSYASRTLKSTRPNPALSKQHQQHQLKHQQAQVHSAATPMVNGPTYRSYDSSNDSEPSYTNSSDGLDIYDQIGAHARLNHQFLDIPTNHNLTPEVHVGEWENMYNR